MSKTTTSKPYIIEALYRSKLEEDIGTQLHRLGLSFDYEKEKINYLVPERSAKYLPDFILTKKDGTKMYIEAKGKFGVYMHRGKQRSSGRTTEERQKLLLVKEQNPDIDLRIVFANAKTTIYKGSPTTYAMWADSHGIKWADGGVIPESWIKELTHG